MGASCVFSPTPDSVSQSSFALCSGSVAWLAGAATRWDHIHVHVLPGMAGELGSLFSHLNPKLTEPAERIKTHYDSKFGEGRYVSKFGAIEPVHSNAAPWNKS